METNERLRKLQADVGEWSRHNFGEQDSKTVSTTYYPDFLTKLAHDVGKPLTEQVTIPLRLGSLAPLLGIGEELGELDDASGSEAVDDAVADTLIYLCDYAEREGVQLADLELMEISAPSLASAYGYLVHCVLKRHQGIRDFADAEYFEQERDKALAVLLTTLAEWTAGFNDSIQDGFSRLVELGELTFSNVVGKRDWTAERKQAGYSEVFSQEKADTLKDRELVEYLAGVEPDPKIGYGSHNVFMAYNPDNPDVPLD